MEIIGLFLQVAVAMGTAFVAGAFCAAFVVFTIKPDTAGRISTAILFGIFPSATVIYLVAFAIFVGVLSPTLGGRDLLFGDGDEPLPNGYAIHYLGKMPMAGWIERRPAGTYGVSSVAALQIIGPRVAGRYDHSFPSEPAANFFLFDTATGKDLDFQTEEQLEQAVRMPIHLTETQYFRGQESTRQRALSWLWFTLAVGLPTLVAVWLALRWRKLRKQQVVID